MKHTYTTSGTCARQINFEIDENGKLHNVTFVGGCNGNLQGIAALAKDMPAEDIISRLKGIRCGFKNTSCPDQLAQALESILANN